MCSYLCGKGRQNCARHISYGEQTWHLNGFSTVTYRKQLGNKHELKILSDTRIEAFPCFSTYVRKLGKVWSIWWCNRLRRSCVSPSTRPRSWSCGDSWPRLLHKWMGGDTQPCSHSHKLSGIWPIHLKSVMYNARQSPGVHEDGKHRWIKLWRFNLLRDCHAPQHLLTLLHLVFTSNPTFNRWTSDYVTMGNSLDHAYARDRRCRKLLWHRFLEIERHWFWSWSYELIS